MEWVGVNVRNHSQPKGVKPKMKGRKLKIVVYRQGASKQKGIKQVGRKTGA
jgi:hypothetical protein